DRLGIQVELLARLPNGRRLRAGVLGLEEPPRKADLSRLAPEGLGPDLKKEVPLAVPLQERQEDRRPGIPLPPQQAPFPPRQSLPQTVNEGTADARALPPRLHIWPFHPSRPRPWRPGPHAARSFPSAPLTVPRLLAQPCPAPGAGARGTWLRREKRLEPGAPPRRPGPRRRRRDPRPGGAAAPPGPRAPGPAAGHRRSGPPPAPSGPSTRHRSSGLESGSTRGHRRRRRHPPAGSARAGPPGGPVSLGQAGSGRPRSRAPTALPLGARAAAKRPRPPRREPDGAGGRGRRQ